MGEDRQDAQSAPPGRKLTVSEAAAALGISAEAVRSRIKRGTLPSVKDGATVYVLLSADRTRPDEDRTPPEHGRTAARSPSDSSALISAKDETIATLREQLASERQAHAEARRLLMAALERIPPALEAPRHGARQEPQESSTPPPEASEGAHSPGRVREGRRKPQSSRSGGPPGGVGCLAGE